MMGTGLLEMLPVMSMSSRYQRQSLLIHYFQFGNYNNRRSRYQQFYNNNDFFRRNSLFKNPRPTTTTTTTTTTPRPSFTSQYSSQCGLRYSSYRADQRARGGRIIWTDEESAGAAAAPEGTFPWLASLFLRRESGEAYFMCAATILTPTVLISAAHCFNEKWSDHDWFVRVGDNYILRTDPSEQTFQVSRGRDSPGRVFLQSPQTPGSFEVGGKPVSGGGWSSLAPLSTALYGE